MKKEKSVYYFRVILDTLFEDDQKEKPYREIALLQSQTLSTIARAIVESFDFDFDHCYGFYDNFTDPYKSKEMYELFTDLGEEPTEGALGVTYVKIPKAFNKIGKKMRFLFDYGDNWQFKVELVDIQPSKKNNKYPKVLKKFGKAPEQYPPLEDEGEEEETGCKNHAWFHEDCILCQELKDEGINLHWFPDTPIKKKIAH